jgi:hypothetical protein
MPKANVIKRILFAAAALSLSPISTAHAACFMPVSMCSYPTVYDAVNDLSLQTTWSMTHSHTIGLSNDNTFFLEFILTGKRSGDMCWGTYYSTAPAYPCPPSSETVKLEFDPEKNLYRNEIEFRSFSSQSGSMN